MVPSEVLVSLQWSFPMVPSLALSPTSGWLPAPSSGVAAAPRSTALLAQSRQTLVSCAQRGVAFGYNF